MKLSLVIRCLLAGLVAISLIEIVFQKCQKITDGDMKNVFIGLFTSSTVVLLIEFINYFYDKKTLSKLEGKYIRIKITNWNSDKGEHDDITEQCSAKKMISH